MSEIIPRNQFLLLVKLINNHRCFDKKSNTFKLSNRKTSDMLKVSASSIDKLFRTLKSKDLVREFKTTRFGDLERMLDPQFVFISFTKTDRYYYSVLYKLQDVSKADQWRRTCRDANGFIDLETGELMGFNWYYIDNIANSYTCFDRTYRKDTPEQRMIEKRSFINENSSQFHNVGELDMSESNDTTQQELDWINEINSYSDYDYPLITSLGSMGKVLSVYKVEL